MQSTEGEFIVDFLPITSLLAFTKCVCISICKDVQYPFSLTPDCSIKLQLYESNNQDFFSLLLSIESLSSTSYRKNSGRREFRCGTKSIAGR